VSTRALEIKSRKQSVPAPYRVPITIELISWAIPNTVRDKYLIRKPMSKVGVMPQEIQLLRIIATKAT
jgi:hypothetical protein